jgi:hypothetical protein
MKKFTVEEAAELHILRQGRFTLVHVHLTKLKPGEALLIEKGVDWISKSPPYKLVREFAAKNKWKLIAGRSTDGKGWIVKRVS